MVANLVEPTADYVRFATHYGFRPGFCHGGDPQSNGMVENLVGYAKKGLMVPQLPFFDLWTANDAAEAWCNEVNALLLRPLPELRPELGIKVISRKVDKLSCVRFGSARYSVPCRLVGHLVTLTTTATMLTVIEPVTGGCWPSTPWSARVRPASPTSTATGPGRTSPAGHPGPGRSRRRWRWREISVPGELVRS